MSSSTLTVAAAAGTITVAVILRIIKRAYSPVIKTTLKCPCGKIQGEISAKQEDSVRLHCYCQDCRTYAHAIANLDDASNNTTTKKNPVVYSCGETRLIQFCKSAISIHKGLEHLKLARQKENTGMFRYYADCCHTPIMNTIDFLGFVGVFEDNLGQQVEGFYGPVCFCTKEATKLPLENVVPDLFAGRFLWNLLRYMPWSKAGPFDYEMQPSLYWGQVDTEKKKS